MTVYTTMESPVGELLLVGQGACPGFPGFSDRRGPDLGIDGRAAQRAGGAGRLAP